ncbi:MAG: 30S ribosomal protein S19e [Candidatus Nanoarchaeia archaeon]|nr:30S ribosomal protein S19e [Candidatus Nanoarchaeia archaeon]MDD5054106.1 30S ribosomal protein S19e [Candidatus Nanoarchaeia archaeon]MDD5499494.1 30S ribosomal protein S19e [Candidatus Nanoarchaeia archaeon]
MVNVFDAEPNSFIEALKEELKSFPKISAPPWMDFVKTSSTKENAPVQKDFWQIRTASILRYIYIHGPRGVSRLRTKYGSKKNRGTKKDKAFKGSGKIIRVILQQLEDEGLLKKVMRGKRKGRELTSKAVKLMDNTAYKVIKK